MNKFKLISFLAIGLLITNLMMAGFIVFRKPLPPQHEGPKKIIADRLHFDAGQRDEYEKLIAVHQSRIRSEDSLIRLTKNELYSGLNVNNETRKDSLEKKLGQLQVEIEEIHYNHFIDIKKLCKENQLSYFNDLLNDLAQLFAKEPNNRPRR